MQLRKFWQKLMVCTKKSNANGNGKKKVSISEEELLYVAAYIQSSYNFVRKKKDPVFSEALLESITPVKNALLQIQTAEDFVECVFKQKDSRYYLHMQPGRYTSDADQNVYPSWFSQPLTSEISDEDISKILKHIQQIEKKRKIGKPPHKYLLLAAATYIRQAYEQCIEPDRTLLDQIPAVKSIREGLPKELLEGPEKYTLFNCSLLPSTKKQGKYELIVNLGRHNEGNPSLPLFEIQRRIILSQQDFEGIVKVIQKKAVLAPSNLVTVSDNQFGLFSKKENTAHKPPAAGHRNSLSF